MITPKEGIHQLRAPPGPSFPTTPSLTLPRRCFQLSSLQLETFCLSWDLQPVFKTKSTDTFYFAHNIV